MKLKYKAIKLRKRGKSYNQINKILNIPKSTLSYWLRDIKLSKEAKKKIERRVYEKSILALIKRNKLQTVLAKQKAEQIMRQAEKEVSLLKKKDLFLTGIALYWGEGYKKGAEGSKWKCVDFANADPDMIRVIMRFFREICGVSNNEFKVQIMLHSGLSELKAVNYWLNVTGLDKSTFMNVSRSVSSASHNRVKSVLQYGTVHIRVYKTDLFFRIIGWINGLKKQI